MYRMKMSILVAATIGSLAACAKAQMASNLAEQSPAAPIPTQTLAAHAQVQVIPLPTPDKTALSGRKTSYSFTVNGRDWVDTGAVLTAGDHVEFTSTGSMTLADGRTANPDGVKRGWKDLVRQFNATTADCGAVVGRVGDANAAVPFGIGAQKSLDVATNGHLYLAANLSSDLTATGSFTVKVKLTPFKESVSELQGTGRPAAAALSSSLFANIPRRVGDQAGDQAGHPGDMVNFALVGSLEQIKKAFAAAGWNAVDKTTEEAVLHGLLSTLSHEAYVEMPMSTLYLFGRPQDLSYARANPLAVAAIRHHLRVWQTTRMVDGEPLWVGSATHDNGFERDQRTGGVTHHIDAEVDQERDFIESSFAAAGVLVSAAYVLPDNPLQTAKTATGGSFHSDGRIVVMILK